MFGPTGSKSLPWEAPSDSYLYGRANPDTRAHDHKLCGFYSIYSIYTSSQTPSQGTDKRRKRLITPQTKSNGVLHISVDSWG